MYGTGAMDAPKCNVCGGSGLIQVDDLTTRPCHCSYVRRMWHHLGPEIATCPVKLKNGSPLFVHGKNKGDDPEYDGTAHNLFIKGPWAHLLPHFRWALSMKGLDFRFRITTDERILRISLGDDHYKNRAYKVREDKETFNNVADLVTDVNLLIIRIGFLGYSNRAMPGYLKEALMIREVQRKPTWLIEAPSSPFGPGHFTYSDDLAAYIDANFEVRDLTDKDAPASTDEPHGFALPEGDVSMGEDGVQSQAESPVKMPDPVFVERDEASGDESFDESISSLMSSGQKKRFGKSKFKKKSSGPMGGSW